MRRFSAAAVVVFCAVALTGAWAPVRAAVIGAGSARGASSGAAQASGWGRAQQVSGLAALTGGTGDSGLTAVSCPSPDECSGGGFFNPLDQPVVSRAFVVSQMNGAWSDALAVPGLAALNVGGSAEVESLS